MAFNSARADAFYLWSQGLLDSRRGTTSAAYLPSDLNVYASSFDQDGSWSYLAPYGYVWYPTVAATWRPYYYGKWRFYGGYGWTFIGHGGRWLYPTHHYGRWGLNPAQRWYWIPVARLVARMGALGRGAGIRWLVSARVEQPSRARVLGTSRLLQRLQPWARVDGRHCGLVRPRLRRRRAFQSARCSAGPSAPSFVVQPTQPRIAVPRGSVVSPNGARRWR